MTEADKQSSGVPIGLTREGDIVQDSQITRAGSVVLSREVLVPLTFGYEVFRDETFRPDGKPETRIWNNYPEGAVMVLPHTQIDEHPPSEATVYLARDIRLYGLGEESAIEGIDGRRGYRNGLEVAREMIEGLGFEAGSGVILGQVNDTSGRQRNITEIVTFMDIKPPTEETLLEKKILALSFEQSQDLIRAGVIQNSATISALWFLGEFLKGDLELSDG